MGGLQQAGVWLLKVKVMVREDVVVKEVKSEMWKKVGERKVENQCYQIETRPKS